MSGITLHVIYGIPCAGKSTAALAFAAENGIRTVIHTDYLREVQRLYVSADDSPVLAHVSHTAWTLTGDRSPAGIASGFAAHAELGMHLTATGQVRKDVDFVIESAGNIPVLREHLPAIRARLGFTEVSAERQTSQSQRYRRVFRNPGNSTDLVIGRRWTAVQAPNGVVTTIRFRDPAVQVPYQLAAAFPVQAADVTITGQVDGADLGNLFPRMFRLLTPGCAWTVHLWWWKFTSPVRDGETVTVHGSRLNLPGQPVIGVSSYTDHYLSIRQ